jgi:DNA end-binding protein Ku
MLELAQHILDTKAGDFDPATFVDHYEDALTELLKRKQAGVPQKREVEQPQPRNVVNLMDALKRSIAAEGATKRKPPATSENERAAKAPARPAKRTRSGKKSA